jgi:Domain of unknown function (DUF4293)
MVLPLMFYKYLCCKNIYIIMIQRIQSIFLAAVVASMVTLLATNIWIKTDVSSDQQSVLSALQLTYAKGGTVMNTTPTFYIAILAALAGLSAAFSILQYKNRVRQLLIGVVTSFLIASAVGLTFYYIYQVGLPTFAPENQGSYTIGFYAAVLGLLANMLANRAIRRDEDLVRSADRMR